MKILLLGATGRVGHEFLKLASLRGHSVTVLVRDPNKFPSADFPTATVAQGDLLRDKKNDQLVATGFDAVVNVIGANPLKPSTVVTDAAKKLMRLLEKIPGVRYVAISGVAEMPKKTFFGRLTTKVMRLTPVGHGIRDHDGAYAVVSASSVDWALICCPYIKDGPTRSEYLMADVFPGGFKIIHPGDVALALLQSCESQAQNRPRITGLWY